MNEKPRRWKVVTTDFVEIQLGTDFAIGLISKEDIGIIKKWVLQVEEQGPDSLWKTIGWDDHALDGNWRGYRASCFSPRGRIIYRVLKDRVEVLIARITPDHDYDREDSNE